MSPVSRIEIDIDDVHLDGFGLHRSDVLAAAIEEELARLIAEEGLPPALGHATQVRRLEAARPRLRPGASVREAGAGIARAIHDGFARGGER
jgi:hypothetical protein